MSRKIKVEKTGNGKAPAIVKYTPKEISYRAWLNSKKDAMGSVSVSADDLKINDCFKVVSLDFSVDVYGISIEKDGDANKQKVRVRKACDEKFAKITKLKRALETMQQNIIEYREVAYQAIDEAVKVKAKYPSQKKVSVVRAYKDDCD